MRRFVTLNLIALAIAGSAVLPANAQSASDEQKPVAAQSIAEAGATSGETGSADGAATAPSQGKTAQATGPKGSAAITTNPVTRAASTVIGTLIGTPVSMVRHSIQESNIATRDLVGDTTNKFIYAAGMPLGVPAGIISGILQGPVWGFLNAYRASKDEPFSHDSMSLGDMK